MLMKCTGYNGKLHHNFNIGPPPTHLNLTTPARIDNPTLPPPSPLPYNLNYKPTCKNLYSSGEVHACLRRHVFLNIRFRELVRWADGAFGKQRAA